LKDEDIMMQVGTAWKFNRTIADYAIGVADPSKPVSGAKLAAS
jgi:hypothetical protein